MVLVITAINFFYSDIMVSVHMLCLKRNHRLCGNLDIGLFAHGWSLAIDITLLLQVTPQPSFPEYNTATTAIAAPSQKPMTMDHNQIGSFLQQPKG